MNEDNQRIGVNNSNSFVDNMGSTSINNNSNIITTSVSNLEKRALPLLYVQTPTSKNLNSSDLNNSTFSVPKSSPPVSNSNGINGGKTIQAFVGTLINRKSQQKVLLTPVKPGQEKPTGVTRILLQGQRPGGIAQVTRVPTTCSSPSAAGTTSMTIGGTSTTSLNRVISSSSQGGAKSTYVVSPVSSNNTPITPTSTSSTSPLMSNNTNRATISIRNAVIIDSPNNNNNNNSTQQTKSAQPNIIRQKIGNDGRFPVNSLLKPSGFINPTSILTKVLHTPSPKLSTTSTTITINKSDKKAEEALAVSDVVLIEDDDDEDDKVPDDVNAGQKSVNGISVQENSTHKPNIGSSGGGGVGGGVAITNGGERARKRKGLLGINNEPPPKIQKNQDKLKLLPGAEDFDPFKIVEWEPNGTGLLPGSNLKVNMTVNELGMLTVTNDTLTERGAAPATVVSDSEDKSVSKKENELDSILCCICCHCYGLPAEFYNASYCSIGCRDAVQEQEESIVKKLEQEQKTKENELKKKIVQGESVKISISNTPGINNSNSNSASDLVAISSASSSSDDKEDNNKGVGDKVKKRSLTNLIESESSEHNNEDKNKLPDFMDGLLKQHSKNESDYAAATVKAKKIVKKGKMFNSAAIKEVKKPLKVDNNKNTTPVTSSKADKQKLVTSQLNEAIKTRASKSPAKIDTSKIRPLVPIKCKSSPNEICQDLDCGNLTPNRPAKAEDPEVEHFPWAKYLEETASRPAWVKLFNCPFPSGVNLFQEGFKLEAIDPEHQSNICAVTVAKVKGYRIKLHFDCYPSVYDFWVNVDSPNIFPCGFCTRHGIPLCPPKGHSKDTFNWLSYNTITMGVAAPTSCFPSYLSNSFSPNLFRVGMKLEAVDRKNTFLVCVATVAGVIDNRILVHFDSWGDVYDYWVNTSSPYIRPVGWCKQNNHQLTPPNGYKPSEFSWPEYLATTKSEAAPDVAFTLRPHNDFRRGMKLEAVDKRAPHLIRVATIKDVLPYQIKITFDGFPEQFGYWVDDDSPDIHPVSWASRTGHPLEPPPYMNTRSACPTPGCIGQGHARHNSLENHTTVENCPYSIDHLNVDSLIQDRLVGGEEKSETKIDEIINLDNDSAEESGDMEKKRWKWLGVREGVVKKKEPVKPAENIVKKIPNKKIKRRKKRRRGFYNTKANVDNNQSKDTSENEPSNQEDLDNMEPLKSEGDPMKWSTQQVMEFTSQVFGTNWNNNSRWEIEDTSRSGSSEDNTEEIDRRMDVDDDDDVVDEDESSLDTLIIPPKRVEYLSYQDENCRKSSGEINRTSSSAINNNKIEEVSNNNNNNNNNDNLPASSNNKKLDQYDAFAEYIAAKLRQFDGRTCAFVKKAFCDAIFSAEIGSYKDNNSDNSNNNDLYTGGNNNNNNNNNNDNGNEDNSTALAIYNSAATTTTTTYTSAIIDKWQMLPFSSNLYEESD